MFFGEFADELGEGPGPRMIGIGIFGGRLVALGKHPIRRGDLALWAAARGFGEASRGGWREGDPNDPAEGLGWTEALAYADWLSEATGRRYRLAEEEEWALAAGEGEARSWKAALPEIGRRAEDRRREGAEAEPPSGNALGFEGFGQAWELTLTARGDLDGREPRIVARGGGRLPGEACERGRRIVGALERAPGMRSRIACDVEGPDRERSWAESWARDWRGALGR